MIHRRQSTEEPSPEALDDPLSPLTLPSSPNSSQDEAAPSSRSSIIVPRLTKRKLEVFVEVPSAPYDISHFKRRLENAKQPNHAHPTKPAGRITGVVQAENSKRLYIDPPRVGAPKKRRAVNVHAVTQDEAASSKRRDADTPRFGPPEKQRGANPSIKDKPSGPSQVEGIALPRFGQPKIKFPKFKKNLKTVSPADHQSSVEDDNLQHSHSSSASHHRASSPAVESTARINPTDEGRRDDMQQASSMALPMQETHIHPASQNMNVIVSSYAATAVSWYSFESN
jgi:hypothetical protein